MKRSLEIAEMNAFFRQFVKERDWEKFHNPKNLTMALAVEAAELMEIFQWMSAQESEKIKNHAERFQAVKEEIADIFIYLLRLSDYLEIDLNEVFWMKMKKNEEKYSLEKCQKGIAKFKEL